MNTSRSTKPNVRLGLAEVFGLIKVQSSVFWPNAILTQKEALHELFIPLYIQCK